MAVQTLQLCIVFAVGIFVGPVAAINGPNRAISVDYPPSLSPSPSQVLQNNVSLRFLEEPSDLVVARGQDATLQCAAKSNSGNLSITWLYENEPVPEKDPRWEIQGSQLRIIKATGGKKGNSVKSNTGEYSCLATNRVGSLLSNTAKVKIGSMDKEVTVSSNSRTLPQSQPLVLRCNVHSIPPADIQWEFNHLPLPKDKRYVPLPNGTLLIRDTKFTESGNYRCLARNSILKKTKYSKDLNIVISPFPVANIPPTLIAIASSVNRTALIGDNVEFMCVASGWPIPTVQWINNNNVTLNSSSTLIIRNAHPKDSGNYTCVASNSLGRSSQTFRLDVLQKPYFNSTPLSKVSAAAQTIRMNCQPVGIPPPKIAWLKNGKPLTPEVRIKKTVSGLVFSHSVSSDTGFYQCVASNQAGRVIWTAAQIEINNSHSPSPPEQVQCRPYDDDKICLTWQLPANVSSVTAYGVYSFYMDNGVEVAGPEPLEFQNFSLIQDLKANTNYTFYIILFSKHVSDHSEQVTCQTGRKVVRNLDIGTVNGTFVTLQWDVLSSDTLCNGTKDRYVVQWYRDGDENHVFSGITLDTKFMIPGLLPATDYQFRVLTENNSQDVPWTPYNLPDNQEADNETLDSAGELRAPKYLHQDEVTSTTARVSWNRVTNARFYTICYAPAEEKKDCTEEDFVKSFSIKYSITKLKPNTQYLVRVRAHDTNNVAGALSQPLTVRTPADVPSPVVDLRYVALNSSTVCVYWRRPQNYNGELKNYLVSYTTDEHWSLENLVQQNVSIDPKKRQSCRHNDPDWISTYLTNLTIDCAYLVMVRAENEVGLGQPFAPIVVKTHEMNDNLGGMLNGNNDAANNQKLGIIMGIILAALCIICCITIILLRRRCLKRRATSRAQHLPSSSNYHPAVAHYTSQMGTVQVRTEEPCEMNEHEIEHLVPDEQVPHIPPVAQERLDTKGASDLPNGCVNGIKKYPRMNGHGLNGAVHITENPQYYAFECNGNLPKNKSEPLLRHHDEDPNSNFKPPKLYAFHRLFEDPDKYKERSKSRSNDSYGEADLNSTQLTFLDDSINSERRLSPLVEPNG